ncbi:hypothetical protein Q5P01_002614 [Channa striata]|uniref:Uncharacterized protein n=1 Tax=Channa striata TaxID=64152 RepID=A0AA88NT25_CHASR|nr:hypothetical protein Q5P01_002614 [Channa striata]
MLLVSNRAAAQRKPPALSDREASQRVFTSARGKTGVSQRGRPQFPQDFRLGEKATECCIQRTARPAASDSSCSSSRASQRAVGLHAQGTG